MKTYTTINDQDKQYYLKAEDLYKHLNFKELKFEEWKEHYIENRKPSDTEVLNINSNDTKKELYLLSDFAIMVAMSTNTTVGNEIQQSIVSLLYFDEIELFEIDVLENAFTIEEEIPLIIGTE